SEGRPERPTRGRRHERGADRGQDRGPGRWRRSAPLPDEFRDPSAVFPADEGVVELEGFVSPREAHMPEFPPAPVNGDAAPVNGEISAETTGAAIVAVETAAPPPETAPPPAPSAPREPTQVVITEADPNRPKKGGWWQRVRTPFGG
ncbi:ribonuclease E/G, partial [Methylocystis sp. 9N]